MANYNKSFNFRNGVQVDNDNFVVNANGLVGIGTTIPTDFLDVYGTSKFNSPIRGTDISLSGLTTTKVLNVGIVSVTSGIVTAISGIVTYYGDGGKLINLPTSQWIDVDSGFGYTSIYSAGNVGVATINPSYNFQVGNNPNTNFGVGFNSTGDIKASGIITANSFSGFGTDIRGINASNISNGTLDNSRLPQNISVSGVVTASTNFSGILIGSLTGNVNSTGVSTFSGGISGNLTGNVNSTGVSTFSGGIVGNLTGNVNSTGVSTFSGGIVGNLTGIADTARSLTGTPNISVGVITATTFTTTTGRIGVGTGLPTSDIQIRKSSGSLLEVISNSGESRISIGQSVGVGKSTGVIRFGSPSKHFDIINNDTGNLNFYLHAGEAGINTGKFVWLYGQSNVELASLSYDGNFGIGKTNPTTKLYVNGTSTITGIASFENNVTVTGSITAGTGDNQVVFGSGLGGTLKNFNLFTNGGISTVSEIHVLGISSIGIGTSKPRVGLDASNQTAFFRQIGINTTNFSDSLSVDGNAGINGKLGIGTTGPIVNGLLNEGVLQVYGGQTLLKGNLIIIPGNNVSNPTIVTNSEFGLVGINTDTPIGPLDVRCGRISKDFRGPFYPPILTNIERNTVTNATLVAPGAIIFNINTLTHEAFNGSEWLPIGLTGNPNITVSNVSVGNTIIVGGGASIGGSVSVASSVTVGNLTSGAVLLQSGFVVPTNGLLVGIATTVANVRVQSGIITTGFGVTSVSIDGNTGIITATNGFSSGIGTAVKITTVGNKLVFTVVGVGSTSLTLF